MEPDELSEDASEAVNGGSEDEGRASDKPSSSERRKRTLAPATKAEHVKSPAHSRHRIY